MLPAILITFLKVGAILTLSVLGYEFAFKLPDTDRKKKRARMIVAAVGVCWIGLEIWSTVRSERDSKELPRKIAEYIKNTTPPPGVSVGLPGPIQATRPMPPEALIGVVDGDWGSLARSLSSQINHLISSQGEPPSQKQGENTLDFVMRSNGWYSNVLDQYQKQFAPQVKTLLPVLIEKGAAQKQLQELAGNPINVLGIRAVATELGNAANKYDAISKQKR